MTLNDLSASQAIYAHRYSLFHPEAVSVPYSPAFGGVPASPPARAASTFAHAVDATREFGVVSVSMVIHPATGWSIVRVEGAGLENVESRIAIQELALNIAYRFPDVGVNMALPGERQMMELEFSADRVPRSLWDQVSRVF